MGQDVNYDETAVPPYELPELMRFADGRPVRSPDDWPERRREILGVFASEMFGQEPPAPKIMKSELVEEGPTAAGLGIRRQYRVWFREGRSGPWLDWIVIIPNRIRGCEPKMEGGRIVCENGAQVPVALFLNYGGNHTLMDDPEIVVPTNVWYCSSASRKNGTFALHPDRRGSLRKTGNRYAFPLEDFIARGIAVMSCCQAQVSPDIEPGKGDTLDMAWRGVFDLWGARDESRDDNPTTLGAWAWALSRGLDLAERIPEIDASRSLVTGCSRLGKAALLAAARDERFAVCVPCQTGGGGAPLAKRFFGENPATEVKMFPHWYCRAYAKYAGKESTMSFDQHWLLAAVAPRALLVEGFGQPWFDTKGEFLACRAASPAWELHGIPGLPDGDFPEPYDLSLVGPNLGYVRRGGAHGLSGIDWAWALAFAERAFENASR
ncbi:MAG: hypothetical protein ILM98_00230 [Kiritimatiellae bacterium]|nr:hypothetical protein [Kiritimatiellia bacterium]